MPIHYQLPQPGIQVLTGVNGRLTLVAFPLQAFGGFGHITSVILTRMTFALIMLAFLRALLREVMAWPPSLESSQMVA
jgi:hypothetical protein